MTHSSSTETSDNIAAYFSTIFTLLLGVCILVVVRFAESGFPWHTYVTLTIGYFVAFGIILVVPIDIASVIYDRKSTATAAEGDSVYEHNKSEVSAAYATFFNTILIFGSFVLVFEEYYNTDGFFTVSTKMWSSFKRMMIDTIAGIVAALIVLGILISEKVVSSNADALQLTAIIVTNTIYEFFLMFLLGYGLVGFPWEFWYLSNIRTRYDTVCMRASADFAEISNSHLNISLEVANALKTKQEMERNRDEELNFAINIILEECPPEFRSSRAGEAAVNKDGKVDIYSLGNLRGRLKFHKSRYRMAQAKVEQTKLEAYYLEDIIDAMDRNDPGHRKFDGVKRIRWTVKGKEGSEFEYGWHTVWKRWWNGFVCFVWVACSVFSFVGAVCSMKGISPYNSPYFLAIQAEGASTGGIVIFILFTLGYTTYVSMWSLFQMRMAGLMDLVPGRTTPESLSFNVRMVARLAAPLVFFYLGWIAENGLKSGKWTYNDAPEGQQIEMNSSFSFFYALQNVGFIEQSFGTLFPVLLIVFIVMFATNAWNYVMVYFKLEYLEFGTPVITQEQQRAGLAQLEKTKKSTVNAARRRRMRSYLTKTPLTEEEGGEDEGNLVAGKSGGSSLLSFLWGGGQERGSMDSESDLTSGHKSQNSPPSGRKAAPTPPPPLNGHAALEGSGTFGLTTKWTDKYLEVRAPGVLHAFDSKQASMSGQGSDPAPLELTDVRDFVNYSNSDKLELKLNTELDNTTRSYTYKFANSAEAADWKKCLIEWKDYSTDHGMAFYKAQAGGGKDSSILGGGSGHSVGALDVSLGGLEAGLDGDDIPASAGNIGDVKPATRMGYVEMNSAPGSSLFGKKDWNRRYMRIDARTGEVCIFNSKDDAHCIHIIKCMNIQSVALYSKRGGDNKRFNLTTISDETFKFQCSTEAEGKGWVQSLNDWKDYALMNMTF